MKSYIPILLSKMVVNQDFLNIIFPIKNVNDFYFSLITTFR